MNLSIFYTDIMEYTGSNFDLRLKHTVLTGKWLICFTDVLWIQFSKSVQEGALYDELKFKLAMSSFQTQSDNASLNINSSLKKHSSLTDAELDSNSYVSTTLPLSYLGFQCLHYICVCQWRYITWAKFICEAECQYP